MSKTTNQNRRPSFTSSTESSMRKRHGPPSSSSSVKPISNTAVMVAQKRAPLGNITNQRKDSRIFPNSSSADSAHCPNKSAKLKLAPPTTQPVCVNACETKSTCEEEVSAVERKAFSNLHVTPSSDTTTNVRRDVLSETENKDDKFMNIDNDDDADPQLCATFACDIYNHLRAAEAKKQPAVDYMETLQKDVNSTMRGILVDWLVEVSEEYRLVPETLYLTVNYIDRYLSGNVISRQKLQLLGVACMMIAAKYEEVCAPQVEEFCYITDNTYLKDEVLDMESAVLNYLKFEMSAPTVKCFLRRFSRAAQGVHEAPCMQLECMASYIAELSLLEYTMLSRPPSLVAASAIFLAKYTLDPTRRPWNSTLRHYTQYEAMELRGCVMDLQRLCSNAHVSTLPAVRDKYSQHKYKFVAKKFCPSIIPPEFFKNS